MTLKGGQFYSFQVGPSPIAISQLLNSVASSLSFKMEDEISIFHLILESRHFTLSLLNVLKFWTCCLVLLSFLQLIPLLLTLPAFLTLGNDRLELEARQGEELLESGTRGVRLFSFGRLA